MALCAVDPVWVGVLTERTAALPKGAVRVSREHALLAIFEKAHSIRLSQEPCLGV